MDSKSSVTKLIDLISNFQMNLNQSISMAIKRETSNLAYKVLLGLVICAAIVFSIIQFGFAYLLWLDQFENKLDYQLISFAAVILLGTPALYLLFKSPFKKKPTITPEVNLNGEFLPNALINLGTGIIEGLLSDPASHKRYHVPVKDNRV
jgi:hypothetical protein